MEREYKNKELEKYAGLCAEYTYGQSGFQDVKSTIYNSLVRSYQKGFSKGLKYFERKRTMFRLKRNGRIRKDFLVALGIIHDIIERNKTQYA